MPEVLNQDEVDALLELVDRGGAGSPEAAAGGKPPAGAAGRHRVLTPAEVHVYDWKRPERISKEEAQALRALHEAFARNVSASLSACLRTAVEVRLYSIEQSTYAEFTMSLPSPTSISLLSCLPLEGSMVLEVNPSIIFPVIDRLLGGGQGAAHHLDRPFTGIELALVSSILGRILGQLSQTWNGVQPIVLEIVESESNPFLMQTIAPGEPILHLSFEALMGEHSGMINLCIPFRVFEPIIGRLSRSSWLSHPEEAGSPSARASILSHIGSAEVEVKAILAEIPLRLVDILTLKPGDVLDTGKPVGSDLVLAVEGEAKFIGQPGLSRGKLAFRITRPLGSEEPAPE